MRYEVASVEEMLGLGRRLAESWNGLGMLALVGPMGAGKTHFSKGFAEGLGYQGEVTSPTFSLVQEYHGGRSSLFHLDWYRLSSANEVLALGWDEFEQQGILLVEWADLFPSLWPDDVTLVRISVDGNLRVVDVEKISPSHG